MGIVQAKLAENLVAVREKIDAARVRSRREDQPVRLVAVTKSVELDTVRDLIDLGQTDIAESRVQQMTQRARDLTPWLANRPKKAPDVQWHLIGHLQRNKVKAALSVAEMIHGVDSLRLSEDISARAERDGRQVDCLLEVNCSGESNKAGVAVGAASHLVEQICTLDGIRLVGLMTMAPMVEDPEQARFAFVRLRELFEEMRGEKIGGKDFQHLSMGMSNDYEVAVEEGATIVRIGRALFE